MRRTLFASLTITLALAACGTDDPDTDAEATADEPTEAADSDQDADFPVTVTDDRGEVELEAPPQRVVSLSPTHTEMLFAVGAGDRVVAVDEQSNHPEEAPDGELSGFEPNVEAILDEDPDLVVIGFDPGDLADSLEGVGVDVLFYDAPPDIDGALAQMEAIGQATGHAEGGEQLVAGLQAEMDAIVEEVEQPDEPLTYYHELDDTYFTATSQTFIGEVYDLLGLENVADPADEDGSGFPQLSAEFLIDADPDLIFVAGASSPEDLAERPGWDAVTAVEEGNLYPVDGNLASRWGPRFVEFLDDVAEAVDDTLERRG